MKRERSHPLVSVIIPTYNRASLILRAVESVLNQTGVELELIVVDDGSTDDTQSVLSTLTTQIRYLIVPHSGVSAARNRGIENARGEWIAFLDSDDYWLPSKLQKQIAYLLSERPADPDHDRYLICHTNEIWIRNGRRINQGKKHAKQAGWFFIPSLHLCLISPSSVLIHRKVFERVGVFDESFPYVEDYDLWLRITAQFPVGYVDEKLIVKTGGHRDQLSGRIEAIEKYRIRSLEKIISSTVLSPEHMDAAISVYRDKVNIYMKGCIKRGKRQEVEELKERMKHLLNRDTLSKNTFQSVGA